MKLETLLFGDYSKRAIKKIKPVADAVDALSAKYREMDEETLRATTKVLRARLDAGETLDDILPDAFAAVRETADRVFGKRPYYVQILGGILLHQGRIAEMKTGEGKTLAATMPAYLNALAGKGVHIVTVNEYLAERDANEMGRIYEYLGLKTGVILRDMSHSRKQMQYASDITYGTSSEFGFDHLRDNLAKSQNQLLQRGHNFCIVDEIDSILIDEARTPLIISGTMDKGSDVFEKCNEVVKKMKRKVFEEFDTKMELDHEDLKDFDYVVDEKNGSALLTPRGVETVEKHFGIEELNDKYNSNAEIVHAVNQLIHAWGVKKKDVDYAVIDDEIIIIDQNTGRLMPGRRYNDGLHQAIEAKEHVNVQGESRVTATITIQNYFRMYSKISGMTGTAKTEEDEFRQIYGLDIVEVPTNKPMIRIDHSDRFFYDEKRKYAAIIEHVKECHAKGQPVLIGTASVEKSDMLAKLLKKANLKFNQLDAKNHEREANIVSAAGRPGTITLATNMAGRGTDIILGGNIEFQAIGEIKAREEIRKITKLDKEFADRFIANIPTATPAHLCYKDPEWQKKLLDYRRMYKDACEKYRRIFEPDRQKVLESGGLCIIGTERHESRRIDNQLRGRAGRQGDPGSSAFYVSLDDDIMRLFGDNRMGNIKKVLSGVVTDEDNGEVTQLIKILPDVLERAQKNVEALHFKSRKNVLQYDDILNEQRKQIFSLRDEILKEGDISERILHMIGSTVEDSIDDAVISAEGAKYPVIDTEALEQKYLGWGCEEGDLDFAVGRPATEVAKELRDLITEKATALYHRRKEEYSEVFHDFERLVLLKNMDDRWLDHIDGMDNLKDNVMLQAYAQKDPLKEYKIIGSGMFADIINEIRQSTVRNVLTGKIEIITLPETAATNLTRGKAGSRQRGTVRRTENKIGPNDPCPCGSGKKYKKCCGAGGGNN